VGVGHAFGIGGALEIDDDASTSVRADSSIRLVEESKSLTLCSDA
jgi:hypothetical protein